MADIVIRPSTLPMYPDCKRRTIARAYRDIVEAAGFKLRETSTSVAAAIGSAVHAGAAATLIQKARDGTLGLDDEAEDKTIETLRASLRQGEISYDEITPAPTSAEKQSRRMVHSYRAVIAPLVKVLAVEERRTVRLGGEFVLSGQGDVIAVEPSGVRDTKTGAVDRVHLAQLGAYSLIYRGHDFAVDRLLQDFIPRVPVAKPQPPPVTTEYSVPLAEQVAEARIAEISRDLGKFLETGNPQAFAANPMSLLCSERWCPAWGTAFCREHRGAK